jgi:hypothetical protein
MASAEKIVEAFRWGDAEMTRPNLHKRRGDDPRWKRHLQRQHEISLDKED